MWDIFIHLFVALFVIIDSFGNIPVFLVLTQKLNSEQRKKIFSKALVFALIILIIFAFLGGEILDYLRVNINSLQIAGGIILLIISLKLIFSFSASMITDKEEDITLTPLATPLLAGPGAIATVMIYSDEVVGIGRLVILSAIFLAIFCSWLVLMNCEILLKILKKNGIKALSKILGLILATLAVEMMFRGIENLIIKG